MKLRNRFGTHWPFLLLSIWLAGTAAAFWQLELKYLRPVDRPLGAAIAHPGTKAVPPVSALDSDVGPIRLDRPGRVTLLNFWNSDCPCSRFMESQVRDLVARYAPRGVRFVTIVEDASSRRADAICAWRERSMPPMPVVYDQDGTIARAFGVWASPGAVILDSSARVRFVGAYNAARFCDNADTAWGAQALASVVKGRPVVLASTPFYGCKVLGGRRVCFLRPAKR